MALQLIIPTVGSIKVLPYFQTQADLLVKSLFIYKSSYVMNREDFSYVN